MLRAPREARRHIREHHLANARATDDPTLDRRTAVDRPTIDDDGVHSTHAEREARADHPRTGDDVPEGDGVPSLEVTQDTTEGGGADRAEMVGLETGGEMDYPEHEETYELFLRITKWGVIVNVVLLIALAIGFYGGGGLFGGIAAFVILLVAARILF